jgi:DNA-binding transcriptional regulator YdaS (Cro superfamily)
MSTDQVEPVLSEVARAIELAGGPAKVARGLRLSTQTVCFYRDGKRRISAEHGAPLEDMTNGQVTRKHIWPNSWPRIWPELAGAATNTSTSTPA